MAAVQLLEYILSVIVDLTSFSFFLMPVLVMGMLSLTIRLVLRRYY